MDFEEYQAEAAKTDDLPDEIALLVAFLGLGGESGSLLTEYKKRLRDGEAHERFSATVTEELGDVLWYVATVASRLHLDLGEIAATNSFAFDVRMGKGGQWNITWRYYYPQWSFGATEHIGYNGKDVFSVVYADKRLDANLKPVPNRPFESNRHPARVCRGPFPVDHSSCIG